MTPTLPEFRDPELSVVMVTHGAWKLTEQALTSLVAYTERPFELIVVDNASKDETRTRLSELRNARVILNEENRGFGPAINQAVGHAHGEYMLLLNTDAFVHPDWLEPLLETVQEDAVGAVVPRFLHPDGSLQDAGMLVARDGTVFAYGDGDDPNRLCYRFRRALDFGTAACMLIRRRIFDALSGFDDLYAPAYYEDADLCLRLAQNGLAVLYEPRATVTHVRFGSGGIDTAVHLTGRNRSLFLERWASELVGRPHTFRSASKQAVIAARDARATPRVLIAARAGEPVAEQLAHMLINHWSSSRLTWAAGTPVTNGLDPSPWLRIGVEVVDQDDPSWLNERLFHYDLVVVGRESDARILPALERTQPQAPRIPLSTFDGPTETLLSRAVPLLIDAGIAPPHQCFTSRNALVSARASGVPIS